MAGVDVVPDALLLSRDPCHGRFSGMHRKWTKARLAPRIPAVVSSLLLSHASGITVRSLFSFHARSGWPLWLGWPLSSWIGVSESTRPPIPVSGTPGYSCASGSSAPSVFLPGPPTLFSRLGFQPWFPQHLPRQCPSRMSGVMCGKDYLPPDPPRCYPAGVDTGELANQAVYG